MVSITFALGFEIRRPDLNKCLSDCSVSRGGAKGGREGASAPPGSSENVFFFFFLAKMIQKMSFK